MKKSAIFSLLGVLLISGCAKLDNYLRPEMSKVETYYVKGQQAEAAQDWEAAFAYYKHAHDLAKERQGIIYFNNPKQDNYPYTITLLYKAMDRVGANIKKPGDWRSPIRQQMDIQQKEMFERMTFARGLFNDAARLVEEDEYQAAMELMDQVIAAYPYSGEAEKARQLKREYYQQLQKYRKRLLNIAMFYYQEQNYEMAKQTFDQLFSSYPDSPEAAKTRAEIKQYIQKIEKNIKANTGKPPAVN